MKLKTSLFIFLLILLSILLGVNYFFEPFKNLGKPAIVQEIVSALPSVGPSASDQVNKIMAFPLDLSASTAASVDWERINKFGFTTIFGEKISSQSAALLKNLNNQIIVDHEGGTVQRFAGAGFTKVPSWRDLCAMPEASMSAVLKKSAQELKNIGVDIVLAPVTDLANSNQVLKSRICSAEVDLVASRSAQLIALLTQQEILPVIKQFPGIGKISC